MSIHRREIQRHFAPGLSAALFLSAASRAFAHHAMDGETPRNFAQGLVSGLAHPVIGLDHLSVVLLLGAVCGALALGLWPLLAFVAASLVGCLVHVARVSLPASELVLALSLVGVGLSRMRAPSTPSRGWTALVAASGVLHGYAYGESIVGAEASPLLAYLTGFGLVQLVLAFGAAKLAARLASAAQGAHEPRLLRALSLACATLGAVGLYVQLA